MSKASTPEHTPVVDIVRTWDKREPERVCLTFYGTHDEPEPVTYSALRREAAVFRARDLRPGDPVVLLADSVRVFVSAFLGAQQVGLLAVPVPRPEPLERGRRTRDRVAEVIRRCHARAVFSPTRDWLTGELGGELSAQRLPVLSPEDLGEVEGLDNRGLDLSRPGVFSHCQFTSGSGGRAKGVLLTHENVLANIRARAAAYEIAEADVAVTWLPFFHDMGLIGYVLHSLVTGCPCHVIPPLRFLTQPVSWLALISRVRATISTAPNLAYGLCVRRISDEEMRGIDLSCWRRAFNGAELVTREVVDAFTRRFGPFGFDPASMLPGYGLAENTLTVTSRRPGEGAWFDEVSIEALAHEGRAGLARGDEPRRSVASVGRPLPGQEVVILSDNGTPLSERQIGEIAVRSGSVMHGYLPGTAGETTLRSDGWLLTGDIGYLAGGELFVLGRKKDLIIRAGRNYYPEDLEEAAARVPGTPIRRVVAFSIPGQELERVILALECRKEWAGDLAQLKAAVRQAVFAEVRFLPDDLVVLPAGTLPLTTSGKVMRPEAKRLYQEGRWTHP